MSQQKLILVVDSREESLILFHQVLHRSGYDVVLAASAREGLDQARRHHPDLILMDPALASDEGAALVGELRSDPATERIPIAALAAASPQLDHALRAAGFCGVVSNRSPLRTLLGAVRHCLEATGGAWPGGTAAVPA